MCLNGIIDKLRGPIDIFTLIRRLLHIKRPFHNQCMEACLIPMHKGCKDRHSLKARHGGRSRSRIGRLAEKIQDEELKKELSALISKSVKDVRAMSYNLAPPDVTKKNLVVSIMNLCQNFQEQSGIEFRMVTPSAVKTHFLTEEECLNIYRIVQESLNNISKHADAQEVTVLVRNHIGTEENGLYIFITDDGVEKVENEADPEKDRGAYLFTETITTIKIYRDVVEKYYLEEFGEEYRDTFAFDDVWELAKNDSTSDDFIYFNFVTSNIDNQMGAGEYLVVDGNTYLSWYFDNHFVLTDWSINTDEWRKSHTAEEFIQLAIEVQQDVEDATRQLESEMDEILEVYKREDEMQDERADGEGLTNPKSQGDGDTDSEAESLVSAEDVTDENSTANTDGTESIDSTESVGSISNTDEGTSEESKSDSNNNN